MEEDEKALGENALETARRHVREAEEHLASQSRLVEEMRARGEETAQAEELLHLLRHFLRLAKSHLTIEEKAARDHGNKL